MHTRDDQREERIDQALRNAALARRWLEAAKQEVRGAQRWGLLDLWFGGWLLSSVKHGQLDEVRLPLRRANAALKDLGRDREALGLDKARLTGGVRNKSDAWERELDIWLGSWAVDDRLQRRMGLLARRLVGALRKLERTTAELRALREPPQQEAGPGSLDPGPALMSEVSR